MWREVVVEGVGDLRIVSSTNNRRSIREAET
jgi:hypothetical protein